jgi:hypothetical protein
MIEAQQKRTSFVPELDMFHPSGDQLIRHVWVYFDHKYLVLASPGKTAKT